jgi:hypothetical protein
MCEVEMRGRVELPAGTPPTPLPRLHVSYGDCLSPTAHVAGQFWARPDGTFFLEVFVPWASDLTLCASYEPAAKGPSTAYGKVERVFHAEKTGEVEFNDVRVVLKPGPPRVFPAVNPFRRPP